MSQTEAARARAACPYRKIALESHQEAEYAWRNGLIDFSRGDLDEIDVEVYRLKTHVRKLFDRCMMLEGLLEMARGE